MNPSRAVRKVFFATYCSCRCLRPYHIESTGPRTLGLPSTWTGDQQPVLNFFLFLFFIMCANCTYCAHILRIVRKLRIFCTYLEDCVQTAHILHMYTSCAHFAHVPNILLVTHILHICRMWFTSAQNECSTKANCVYNVRSACSRFL